MTNTESFGRGRIAQSILATEAVPFTLKVSSVPNNENQYITINPDTTSEEIFFYTTKTGTIGEAGTIEITGRGFNAFGVATEDVANQNQHDENVEFKIALNHIIIGDKADIKTTNTFEQDITFEGDVLFTTTDNLGLKVNSLTTVERDLITPANGYIIYNTTDGLNQQYISGAWNDIGNTGTPDATETAAGKVEKSTTAQIDAKTEFGETGATLFVNPSQILDASETDKGIVTLATDAEVILGSTEDVVTASQLREFAVTTEILQDTQGEGSTTTVIAHSLGVIPKSIHVTSVNVEGGTSVGYSDGTNNMCSFKANSIAGNDSNDCLASYSNVVGQGLVGDISVDASNVTIIYTWNAGQTIGTTFVTLNLFA